MDIQLAIVAILSTAVNSSIVTLLPALGECVSQRSGIINIGLEGFMMMGCLFSYYTTYLTGNLFFGFLMGIFGGMLLSLIHAFFCISLKCNQIICGTGIWLFGVGVTGYIFRAVGIHAEIEKLKIIHIPILSKIPYIGPIMFQHNIFVYISIAMVYIFFLFLNKTKLGILNKGAGDSPFSTDMAGHNPFLIRYISTLISGGMAGLGGAYLATAILNRFSEGMSAGRGFIALCIVIFGGWDPKKILLGSLFFGIIDAFQLHMQVWSIIPYPLLIIMPYLFTIIVVSTVSRKKSNMPRKLAVPYIRGEK